MFVLVEGAAKSRPPSYVQMGDPVRVLDRSGQRVEGACIRKTLVRPMLVIGSPLDQGLLRVEAPPDTEEVGDDQAEAVSARARAAGGVRRPVR